MNKTSKIINVICDVICLVLWTFQLIFGVIAVCGAVTISPIAYICAVLICVMHYVYKLADI